MQRSTETDSDTPVQAVIGAVEHNRHRSVVTNVPIASLTLGPARILLTPDLVTAQPQAAGYTNSRIQRL